MMITEGRIVSYKWGSGDPFMAGNNPVPGQIVPAIIVRAWNQDPGTVNLYVFVDGPTPFWATSRTKGDGAGQWNWPTMIHESVTTRVSPERANA